MKPVMNNSINILIAEDSRTQAEQLRFLLENQGYRVTVAVNGKLALEAAQAQKPTLLISDVMMPEMGGYELCKAIKSDEELKDIPIILVTTLTDAQDVFQGLECGADNFIRKPYDERYLLSRIEYLLMNLELRKHHKMRVGVEIKLGGQKFFINSERQQILDLLISTYEQAVDLNTELKQRETELESFNQVMNGLFNIAEGLNRAMTPEEVAEIALARALELPGVQSGWICMLDGESGFEIVATRNLPSALSVPGALDGDCKCRKQLLSDQSNSACNIVECERIAKLEDKGGDTGGLRCHATVPLWLAGRTVGLMNLVGPNEGLFDEAELKILHGVGNQVAVAMERARLHEHLEKLVEERTAALHESEGRYRNLVEGVDAIVWEADAQTLQFTFVNCHAELLLGYPLTEWLTDPTFWVDHIYPADREQVVDFYSTVVAQGKDDQFEYRAIAADGKVIWLRDIVHVPMEPDGSVRRLRGLMINITQHKANEARIARLNRVYRVLSGINTTIVRVREDAELFVEACRIAVEDGGFIFAWIGKFDADSEQVTPVARSGRDDGYLAKINLTVHENTPGNCALTAQALTEATPAICNDIASDERMVDWSSEALSRGYGSVAVFPIMLESRPVGVFALYAPEAGVFDDDEMKLLVEMSGDISFALETFHIEAQRKQAESMLAEQLEELRRWHSATLGREMRSIELKREVNELLGQAGQPPRYSSVEENESNA